MIEMEHKESKFNINFKEKDIEKAKLNGWTEVKQAKRPIIKPKKEDINNG